MIDMQGSGSGCCLIEVISQHLPGGTEENYEKPVSVACVSAEIRSEHLRNTRVEPYHHTNLFGGSGLEVNVETDIYRNGVKL
jgi:hypothetical protein